MTDYTTIPESEKQARSKRQMLWFGIASLVMMFAGLTSAYVVSSTRRDWKEIPLPEEFIWSTGIILLSSLCLILAGRAIKSRNKQGATILVISAAILGGAFVTMQFAGFDTMVEDKIFFTGGGSNIKGTYIYLIVLAHLAHIAAGLICLIVVAVQAARGKYSPEKMLGFELGANFWHFVDVLWVYLLLFLLFADDLF